MARTKSWQKKKKKKKCGGKKKLWREKKNCGGEKKNNEANWMVSNSEKLDRRTKQHTQSGVSTSDGSRDIAATKGDKIVAEKKKKI